MRRMLAAATVAALSFASFAGCAQDDASPTPTRSPAASSCSPSTAVISWEQGVTHPATIIGAYVLKYSRSDANWDATLTGPGDEPEWDDSGIAEIASTASGRAAWRSALLADANRTGQVGTDFGKHSAGLDQNVSPATPSEPDPRTFVTTVSEKRVTMPFTINCRSPKNTVTGTVTAPFGDGVATAVWVCGVTASSEAERLALGYCP